MQAAGSLTVVPSEEKTAVGRQRWKPTVFSLKQQPECKGPYRLDEEISTGAYGTVYSACSDSDCKYLVKESLTGDFTDLVSSKVDAIMLKSLQGQTYTNSRGEQKPLVPTFYDAWRCPGGVGMALDRWDGDMQSLASSQYLAATGTTGGYLYTRQQLEDMFNIAKRLDELGVVEGDNKPNQYLYRGNDIAITDFGLAGTYGWASSPSVRCPSPFVTTGAGQVPPELREYFNQWQLAYYLANFTRSYVQEPSGEMSLFTGLEELPSEWQTGIAAICKSAGAMQPSTGFRVRSVRGWSPTAPPPSPAGTPTREKQTLSGLGRLERELDQHTLSEEAFNAALEEYLSQ